MGAAIRSWGLSCPLALSPLARTQPTGRPVGIIPAVAYWASAITHVSGTGGAGNLAFARAAEQANPGFYSVMLGSGEKEIGVELAASRLAGFHRYRFPGNPEARIILNASATIPLGGGRPRATGGQRTVVDATHVAGQMAFAGGWGQAKPYTLYFHALFDRPAREVGRWHSSRGEFRKLVGEGTTPGGDSRSGLDNRLGALATFDTRENPLVQMKLAVSSISVEQAARNFEREPGWSFASARSECTG